MSLSDLFKKQEGGSVVGNLIRTGADAFTGGVASKLLPPPSASDMAAHNAKIQGMTNPNSPLLLKKQAEYAAKNTVGSAVAAPAGFVQTKDLQFQGSVTGVSGSGSGGSSSGKLKEWFIKNKVVVIIVAVVGVLGTVWAIVRRKGKSKNKR